MRWLLLVTLVAGCAPLPASVQASDSPRVAYVQANLAGGWADGAELRGSDDVVVALVAVIEAQPVPIRAVFLNEACESHATDVAARLGPGWRAHFVRAWDGHSDCFPAPGAGEGRFGNAVVVRGDAMSFVIPSCDDHGADLGRCLPNWSPPAEQRRAVCASTGDGPLLCSVHLDPKRWSPHGPQLAALGRIAGELVAGYGAVVVGGDLNDGPDAVSAVLADGFVDATALTHPSATPRRAIDHVLLSGAPAWEATAVDLGACAATHRDDGRCSDHRALVVSVALR